MAVLVRYWPGCGQVLNRCWLGAVDSSRSLCQTPLPHPTFQMPGCCSGQRSDSLNATMHMHTCYDLSAQGAGASVEEAQQC